METKNILVVEDDFETLEAIEFILHSEHYSVCVATDGGEAMTQIMNHRIEHKRIDCIITDLMMPRYNGISFISCLEAIGEHFPIIVIWKIRVP